MREEARFETEARTFSTRAVAIALILAGTVLPPTVAWCEALPQPVLAEPSDGAVTTMAIPHFAWQPAVKPDINGMPSHWIQIARDSNFERIVDEDKIAATISWYVPDYELAPGVYWWRLTAVDAKGVNGKWSAVRQFTIRSPERVIEIKRNASFSEIRKALAQAAAQAPATVRFEKGEYRLDPGALRTFIHFKGAHDLTVDGNGASITLSRPVGWVDLEDCERVLLKDLTLSFQPPAYTAGRIVAVKPNQKYVEAEILPNHALPTDWPAYERDRKGMIATESEGFAIKKNAPLVVSHEGFEQVSGRRFRFHFETARIAGFFSVGDVYILDPRWLSEGGGHGAVVKGGEDVVFLRLNIRSAANECLGSFYANRHAILHVRLERPDGFALSVNNGGNNHHNARTGPWIEGCLFENCGDDACHVNGYLFSASKQPKPDRIVVEYKQFFDVYGVDARLDIRPGDRLIFFQREKGRVLKEARVLAAKTGKDSVEIRLDTPIIGLKTGRIAPSRTANYPANDNSEVTEIYNGSRMCNQFVFRNNQVRNSRRVGVLAKGPGGLIEGNTFESLGGGGVEFWNAPFEGLGAEDYVVWRNRILNCGRLARQHAAIWGTAFPTGAERLHRNLLISNNEIAGFPGTAILLSDVENAVVQDNNISSSPPGDPIRLKNTLRVQVQNNISVSMTNRQSAQTALPGRRTSVAGESVPATAVR